MPKSLNKYTNTCFLDPAIVTSRYIRRLTATEVLNLCRVLQRVLKNQVLNFYLRNGNENPGALELCDILAIPKLYKKSKFLSRKPFKRPKFGCRRNGGISKKKDSHELAKEHHEYWKRRRADWVTLCDKHNIGREYRNLECIIRWIDHELHVRAPYRDYPECSMLRELDLDRLKNPTHYQLNSYYPYLSWHHFDHSFGAPLWWLTFNTEQCIPDALFFPASALMIRVTQPVHILIRQYQQIDFQYFSAAYSDDQEGRKNAIYCAQKVLKGGFFGHFLKSMGADDEKNEKTVLEIQSAGQMHAQTAKILNDLAEMNVKSAKEITRFEYLREKVFQNRVARMIFPAFIEAEAKVLGISVPYEMQIPKAL